MSDTPACPNCGHPLSPSIAWAKMVDCEACGTTVHKAPSGLSAAGDRGVMLDLPSLLQLETRVRIDTRLVTPVGHLRFDYGPGVWDEYWCETEPGAPGLWVSVDEGDYAVERPLSVAGSPRPPVPLRVGAVVEHDGVSYTLNELDEATCVAFRGALPEVTALGETHRYANFTSADGTALSFEIWDGGSAWFAGEWIDPWRIGPAS